MGPVDAALRRCISTFRHHKELKLWNIKTLNICDAFSHSHTHIHKLFHGQSLLFDCIRLESDLQRLGIFADVDCCTARKKDASDV